MYKDNPNTTERDIPNYGGTTARPASYPGANTFTQQPTASLASTSHRDQPLFSQAVERRPTGNTAAPWDQEYSQHRAVDPLSAITSGNRQSKAKEEEYILTANDTLSVTNPLTDVDITKKTQNLTKYAEENNDWRLFSLDNDSRYTRNSLIRLMNFGPIPSIYPVARSMMDHYLNGDGSSKKLPIEWVRDYTGTTSGELKSMRHYQEWLTGSDDNMLGPLSNIIRSHQGEESWTIPASSWDGGGSESYESLYDEYLRKPYGMTIDGLQYPSAAGASDQYFVLGDMTVKGSGPLYFRRQGNKIIIEGDIQFHVSDRYDFRKGGLLTGYQPIIPDIGAKFPWINRNDMTHLEDQGGARYFNLESDKWGRKFVATLVANDDGTVSLETMHWSEPYFPRQE